MIPYFEMVFCKAIGDSPTARRILFSVPLTLYVIHNGQAHEIGNATMRKAGPSEIKTVRTLYNHGVLCGKITDLVVAQTEFIVDVVKDFAYPIYFTRRTRFHRLWKICPQADFMHGVFEQSPPSNRLGVDPRSAGRKPQL